VVTGRAAIKHSRSPRILISLALVGPFVLGIAFQFVFDALHALNTYRFGSLLVFSLAVIGFVAAVAFAAASSRSCRRPPPVYAL